MNHKQTKSETDEETEIKMLAPENVRQITSRSRFMQAETSIQKIKNEIVNQTDYKVKVEIIFKTRLETSQSQKCQNDGLERYSLENQTNPEMLSRMQPLFIFKHNT